MHVLMQLTLTFILGYNEAYVVPNDPMLKYEVKRRTDSTPFVPIATTYEIPLSTTPLLKPLTSTVEPVVTRRSEPMPERERIRGSVSASSSQALLPEQYAQASPVVPPTVQSYYVPHTGSNFGRQYDVGATATPVYKAEDVPVSVEPLPADVFESKRTPTLQPRLDSSILSPGTTATPTIGGPETAVTPIPQTTFQTLPSVTRGSGPSGSDSTILAGSSQSIVSASKRPGVTINQRLYEVPLSTREVVDAIQTNPTLQSQSLFDTIRQKLLEQGFPSTLQVPGSFKDSNYYDNQEIRNEHQSGATPIVQSNWKTSQNDTFIQGGPQPGQPYVPTLQSSKPFDGESGVQFEPSTVEESPFVQGGQKPGIMTNGNKIKPLKQHLPFITRLPNYAPFGLITPVYGYGYQPYNPGNYVPDYLSPGYPQIKDGPFPRGPSTSPLASASPSTSHFPSPYGSPQVNYRTLSQYPTIRSYLPSTTSPVTPVSPTAEPLSGTHASPQYPDVRSDLPSPNSSIPPTSHTATPLPSTDGYRSGPKCQPRIQYQPYYIPRFFYIPVASPPITIEKQAPPVIEEQSQPLQTTTQMMIREIVYDPIVNVVDPVEKSPEIADSGHLQASADLGTLGEMGNPGFHRGTTDSGPLQGTVNSRFLGGNADFGAERCIPTGRELTAINELIARVLGVPDGYGVLYASKSADNSANQESLKLRIGFNACSLYEFRSLSVVRNWEFLRSGPAACPTFDLNQLPVCAWGAI